MHLSVTIFSNLVWPNIRSVKRNFKLTESIRAKARRAELEAPASDALNLKAIFPLADLCIKLGSWLNLYLQMRKKCRDEVSHGVFHKTNRNLRDSPKLCQLCFLYHYPNCESLRRGVRVANFYDSP